MGASVQLPWIAYASRDWALGLHPRLRHLGSRPGAQLHPRLARHLSSSRPRVGLEQQQVRVRQERQAEVQLGAGATRQLLDPCAAPTGESPGCRRPRHATIGRSPHRPCRRRPNSSRCSSQVSRLYRTGSCRQYPNRPAMTVPASCRARRRGSSSASTWLPVRAVARGRLVAYEPRVGISLSRHPS